MLGGVTKILLAGLCLSALPGCASLDWSRPGGAPNRDASASKVRPAAENVDISTGTAADKTGKPAPVEIAGPAQIPADSPLGVAENRDISELRFVEIDPDSIPSPEQHARSLASDSRDTSSAGRNKDLWQRLRSGFRLSNLEGAPGRVEKFERWYAKHPKYFERLAERAYWFLPYVLDQVEARNMPAEVALLPAIESAFRPDATSTSHAAGMWQFVGATGRRFGLRQDWWMDARRDLVQSTRAALDFLEFLAEEFHGDWELALAGYNAGEGGIGRRIRKNKAQGLPTDYIHLKLRRETAEYVPRLFAVRNILMNPEKYNVKLPPLEDKHTLAVVDLKSQTDLTVAASMLSLTRKQLHFLNLGYRRGVTPPNGPHTLVVPVDEADTLLAEISKLSQRERMQWARHKVRRGEYLGKIARIHGVTIGSIRRANKLKSNLIKPGQELRIPLSGGAYQFAGPALAEKDARTRTHLVSKGDTLWTISRRYGISLASVMSWNNLSKRTILQPGQSIVVRP